MNKQNQLGEKCLLVRHLHINNEISPQQFISKNMLNQKEKDAQNRQIQEQLNKSQDNLSDIDIQHIKSFAGSNSVDNQEDQDSLYGINSFNQMGGVVGDSNSYGAVNDYMSAIANVPFSNLKNSNDQSKTLQKNPNNLVKSNKKGAINDL